MENLKIRYLKAIFISFSTILAITQFLLWLNGNGAIHCHLRADINHFLSDKLIRINPPSPETKVDALYVLGGSQRSLEYKYKIAADLFHKGICNRIWILSRTGKTEYSPSLGRNLTNDEWSLLKFKELKVPEEYIEAIKIEEGFFGTFSEAKGISSLVKKKRYKSIILISEPYHSHRVKISFGNFLNKQGPIFHIKGSEEKVFLSDLIVEFFKLKVYQYFLI
jgi:hypothetical protein